MIWLCCFRIWAVPGAEREAARNCSHTRKCCLKMFWNVIFETSCHLQQTRVLNRSPESVRSIQIANSVFFLNYFSIQASVESDLPRSVSALSLIYFHDRDYLHTSLPSLKTNGAIFNWSLYWRSFWRLTLIQAIEYFFVYLVGYWLLD